MRTSRDVEVAKVEMYRCSVSEVEPTSMIMHLWSVIILSTSRSFNHLWSGCADCTQRVQLGDVCGVILVHVVAEACAHRSGWNTRGCVDHLVDGWACAYKCIVREMYVQSWTEYGERVHICMVCLRCRFDRTEVSIALFHTFCYGLCRL